MTAIIWLFFLISILMAMYWYKQNKHLNGTFDRTHGLLAMKDEFENSKDPDGRKDQRTTV